MEIDNIQISLEDKEELNQNYETQKDPYIGKIYTID